MEFLWDNAVPIAAIILGIAVVLGIGVAAIAAFRLWRDLKAARRRIAALTDILSAEAARLSDALAAMPDRRAELQGSLADLSARASVLGMLAGHAAAAAAVLRGPLRFIGR